MTLTDVLPWCVTVFVAAHAMVWWRVSKKWEHAANRWQETCDRWRALAERIRREAVALEAVARRAEVNCSCERRYKDAHECMNARPDRIRTDGVPCLCRYRAA